MARAMKDSGVEWLGDIPADWEVIKLKYLFSIIGGNGFPDILQGNEEGDYPFCKVSDINGEADYVDTASNWVTQAVVDNNRFNVVPTGSIIMAKIGAALAKNHRKINLVKCCIDNNTQALVPKRDDCTRYLLQLSKCIDMSWFDNKSTVPSINNPKLLNSFVPNVPLDEQQRIAAFLDRECARIDSVVEKTRASIEEYRKLKQAIITRAVTKGIRPNRPTKDSGIDWIRQIPESYDVRRIKYLGSYRNGLTYTPNELVDETEGTLVLRSSNIQQGQLCFTDNVYVKTDIPDRLLVQKGDIIICSRNGSRDLIGKCAIVENDMVASFGAFMMIFRCVAPKYMYYILNSDVFKYYLSTFRTSTINQLTSENFGNMEIVWCADKTEQKEIAAYLDEKTAAIDSLVAKKNRLVSELESLKKSLIFEYVTGKKEVPT